MPRPICCAYCRKHWEDLSGKLLNELVLENLIDKRDESINRQACALYHELTSKRNGPPTSGNKGDGRHLFHEHAFILGFLLCQGKHKSKHQQSASVHAAAPPPKKAKIQCEYCKKFGHTADVCRKKMADLAPKGTA